MSDLLFDVPTQLSPRLAWMAKYMVTAENELAHPMPFGFVGRRESGHDFIGILGKGHTEDDALTHLAQVLGIPLWNEDETTALHGTAKRTKKAELADAGQRLSKAERAYMAAVQLKDVPEDVQAEFRNARRDFNALKGPTL